MASSPSSSSSSLSPPPSTIWKPPSRARISGGNNASPPPLMEGVKDCIFPPKANRPYPEKMSNGTVKHAINKMMDCHLDWVGDMMPGYMSLEEKKRLIGTIIDILCKYLEDTKTRISSPGKALNIHLMLACFHAHLLNFDDALNWIVGAVDSLKVLSEESRAHLQAYSYLLQANYYKISKKMKLMEGMTMKVVEQGTAEDLKRIQELYNDESGFQAVIYASKGLLSALMAHQDSQIELYRLSVEIEPACPQWHRMLYQALRKKRREVGIPFPSYEEKTAITTAFRLNENCCLTQPHYAGMLEEELKGCKDKELMMTETKKEIGEKIISLMESALEKNPEDRWAHVRLAEIYGYGNFPHLDAKNRGKCMFEELERRWPKDSMVLHKFGRYFFLTEENLTKALEYYTRGLDCDLGNFPCLMDFLKTSQKLNQDPKVMLEVLEKCLGFGGLYNTGPFVKMMVAKGIFLWTQDSDHLGPPGANKHKACQAWIEAASKDLSSCVFIANKIACGYWIIIGGYCIDIAQVVDILSDSLRSSKDKANAIRRLISELQNAECNNRSGTRQRYRTLSSSSSTSSCSYVTAKSSFSQADSVDNWRKAPPAYLPPLVGDGVFARYIDPMEQCFNDRLARLNLGELNAASSTQQNTGIMRSGGGYAKNAKKISQYQAPSQADLDDHWRR